MKQTGLSTDAQTASQPPSPGTTETSPELLRLAALARYRLDEHAPLHEAAFERLTGLAARLFQVPTALISFMGEQWQWWGASCGLELLRLPERGIQAAQGLCGVVVQSGRPLFVADTAQEETYAHHPLVTGNGVRFYAGVPLTTPDGHVIGTLCLLDTDPHAPLTPAEQQTLGDLAALVMDELELRLLSIVSERHSSAHELLSHNLREALAQSETLQAISELNDLGSGNLGGSDLGLSLDELLLRAVALCASVCDVDLGSLVALYEDRAFIFPAWHSPRAERLAALVSRGLRRSECQNLWADTFSGGRVPVFVNDYGSQSGAHLAMAQAGVRAQAYVPVGGRGGVRFVMVLSRLNRDRPWRPQQRQLIIAVARLAQGLSLQRQQQEALATSTAQLELALGGAPMIMFGTDAAGTFQILRGSGLAALNMGGLTGRSVDDVFANAPQIVRNVHRAIGGENFGDVVTVGHLSYDVRYVQVRDTYGNPAGMLGVGYDVTELVQSGQRALQSQREAKALLELAQAVNLDVLDPSLADAALDALLRVLGGGPGRTQDEGLGGGLLILWQLGPDGYHAVSQRGAAAGLSLPTLDQLHAGGVPVHVYDSLIGVTDRNVYLGGRTLPPGLTRAGVEGVAALPLLCRAGQCLVGLMAYAERPWNPAERELLETAASLFGAGLERRQRVLELEYDARTDALTGAGNRRALNVALAYAVAQASSHQGRLCVVSIDLDGLKAVNDQYGHARGDALLSQFSADLRAQLPVGGELYRLGGDEFVAVYPATGLPAEHPASWPTDAAGPQDHRPYPEWLERAVAATRRTGFEMTAASAGTACFPEDASTAAELLRQSDERLYAEKEKRGDRRA